MRTDLEDDSFSEAWRWQRIAVHALSGRRPVDGKRFFGFEGAIERCRRREVHRPRRVCQASNSRRAHRKEGDPRPGEATEFASIGAGAHHAGVPTGQSADGGQPPS
eukprot:4697492-Pyramimonas_sp.AAC.1